MENIPGYQISTDKQQLDLPLVHKYLSTESYWAGGVPYEVVTKSVAHSYCFGVYHGAEQVGFARVVTDQATFAYLADVFIVTAHRGKGLAKQLVATILADPQLQGLRRWMLGTLDAHGLYEKFGFGPLPEPGRFMQYRPAISYGQTTGEQKSCEC